MFRFFFSIKRGAGGTERNQKTEKTELRVEPFAGVGLAMDFPSGESSPEAALSIVSSLQQWGRKKQAEEEKVGKQDNDEVRSLDGWENIGIHKAYGKDKIEKGNEKDESEKKGNTPPKHDLALGRERRHAKIRKPRPKMEAVGTLSLATADVDEDHAEEGGQDEEVGKGGEDKAGRGVQKNEAGKEGQHHEAGKTEQEGEGGKKENEGEVGMGQVEGEVAGKETGKGVRKEEEHGGEQLNKKGGEMSKGVAASSTLPTSDIVHEEGEEEEEEEGRGERG